MARLLITTFNGPNFTTGAALRFKLGTQGLLEDILDEIVWDQWPNELRGLKHEGDVNGTKVRMLGFLWLGMDWPVLYTKLRSKLEEGLRSLYSRPIHCWVVGGHHEGHYPAETPNKYARYEAMLWGKDVRKTEGTYWPYAGFGLQGVPQGQPQHLEWFGYRDPDRPTIPLTLPMPEAAAQLRHCRLMIVLGCNGIPAVRRPNGKFDMSMGQTWHRWLTGGSGRPLILGWFKPKKMPPNSQTNFATDLFTAKMSSLAQGLPSDRFLSLTHPQTGKIKELIDAWGASCYEAFHNMPTRGELNKTPPFRDLWLECGAIDPDRKVWHANPDYKGLPGVAPLTHKWTLPENHA